MTQPDATSADILKSLLEEQQKKATEIDDKDDLKTITQKLLKQAGRPPLGTSPTAWSSANQVATREPLVWFYLIATEQGAAVCAILSLLNSFPQRHITKMMGNTLQAMVTVCALLNSKKLTTYEAFTICEPLLHNVFENYLYLSAKTAGEQLKLSSNQVSDLMVAGRPKSTLSVDKSMFAEPKKLNEKGGGKTWKRRRYEHGEHTGRRGSED
jgi:hypothetical protein